jgi:RNA polymerase sigma-70 factor (ECF subfamily)
MGRLTERTDQELMLAARAGELDALDLLFVRHHRRLYGFLARLTGDRHVAEDLVQEVFLRLLRFRTSYSGDGSFVAWLFRIARNVAADQFARRRAVDPIDPDTAAVDEPSALDRMVTDERRERYERALRTLPAEHREALLLRGTEGLPYRDVAAALGCSEGAARVRVHRALVAIKRTLHALAGDTA